MTLVNCLVHIRRYFEQALEENRKPASWFLRKIQELYHIEHECDKEGMTPDQRKLERQARSKPLMEEMRTWMETEGLCYSQSTLIGKAVGYAYTRWNNMMHILEDGRLLLDNNLAEMRYAPLHSAVRIISFAEIMKRQETCVLLHLCWLLVATTM